MCKLALILMLLFSLASCEFRSHYIQVSLIKKDRKVKSIPPAGGAQLLTQAVTNKITSDIRLTCDGGATHYIESATAPLSSDWGWSQCPSGTFTITENIVSGLNTFSYWFKNSQGEVTLASSDVNVHSGTAVMTSPDPQNDLFFGVQEVVQLSPTRILVTDSYNSRAADKAGAVHIFNEVGQLVKSVYGVNAHDNFGGDSSYFEDTGEGSTLKLSGNKFAVSATSYDGDDGSLPDSGAVFVYDHDGEELYRFSGDNAGDFIGNVFELNNGNIVVCSYRDNVSGLASAGSAALLNGADGTVIASFTGTSASDQLCFNGVSQFSNGIALIKSSFHNGGRGKLTAIHPETGSVLWEILGDDPDDNFGKDVIELSNGNFIVSTYTDDVGGITNAGSVKLFNSTTGALVSTLTGSSPNDNVGTVTVLGNNNFIVSTTFYDSGAVTDAGRVWLINGSTGTVISSFTGDVASDRVGSKIVQGSGSFMIISPQDNVGGITDNGSWFLVHNTTGAVISSGNGVIASDGLTMNAASLGNGNFLLSMPYFNVGAINDAGRVMLINGVTGAVISTYNGDNASDTFGGSSLGNMGNGRAYFTSSLDDVSGVINAGSVTIINSDTGAVVGFFAGDHTSDAFGSNVTILPNGNLVLNNSQDDHGGLSNVGSIMLINGSTGAVITTIRGDTAQDGFGGHSKVLSSGKFYIGSYLDDYAGIMNAGTMVVVDPDTGSIIHTFAGSKIDERISNFPARLFELNNDTILLSSPVADESAFTNLGVIRFHPLD